MIMMLAKDRFLPATTGAQRKIASSSKGVAGGKMLVRKLCPANSALGMNRRSFHAKRTGAYSIKIQKIV
jgi:hypothetical protein